MSTQDRTEQAPSLAAKLRAFADFLDANPVLEEIPEVFNLDLNPSRTRYSVHLVGEEAALIDKFAAIHGVSVGHRVHGPKAEKPGARYSSVEKSIGGVAFRLQADTDDYEKATGKTVDNGGAR